MSGLISVITPVREPATVWLPDAYASLAAQELPDEWAWEWLVQGDGQQVRVTTRQGLPVDDPRIRVASGRRGGPGIARNLALAHARGQLVKALDADDQLCPGTLARDIAVLEDHPGVDWTTSRVLDLLPDGSTVGFEHDPAAGPLAGGGVFQHWLSHNYRAPVHPATLCVRREVLVALGGWMALPASEDTGLLIALSVVAAGWFHAEAGLLYRKWEGQATNQAAHTHNGEWAARMKLIEDRANALRALGQGGRQP